MRYKIYLDKIDEDSRTTLMIANIPNKYTMEDLMQKIDSKGHKDKYDYFYIPVDLEVLFSLLTYLVRKQQGLRLHQPRTPQLHQEVL